VTASPRSPKTARRLSELAALVGGEVIGDGSCLIDGVATLEDAGPGQLSFFGSPKYKRALAASKAQAVLVPKSFVRVDGPLTLVRVESPHLAFARVAQEFAPAQRFVPGVSPAACVDPSAQIDASATVLPGAFVSALSKIGARAVIGPGCFVGERATIGDDTRLVANVSVLHDCSVGARCLLHPGVVIGADGFGFAFDPSVPAHVKIPQTGIARVEDDVEIGANSCVDRSTTGETVVGRGTKIDNLVQVGHNCRVGPLSILCAQVGLAGSTELGTGVMMGGQAGSAGHNHIGDLAKIGAQSGVLGDVADGAELIGSPPMPVRDFMRVAAVLDRLPEIHKHVRALERRLAELEKEREKP